MAAVHHGSDVATWPGRRQRKAGRRLRRLGLGLFFASVAVNAALGVYALLSPDFGDTQGKILGTSLCVTGAALLALACEPAWERGLLGPVPYAGAALGTLAFALAVAGMWAQPDLDAYGRFTGSTFTVALTLVLASLLALARLAGRRAWVFAVTLGLLGSSGVALALPWWWDDPSELYLRGVGVLLVVLAAFVVTVPVLHWIDRGTLAASPAGTEDVRFCPYCGYRLSGGATDCGRCGREFRVVPATPRAST